jgi:CubicO group peptidase (beta-lactamase class C family)
VKRRVKRSLQIVSVLFVLCLLLLAAGALRSSADIPSGTGYAAWDLCTRTLQDGEDFEWVKQFYVAPKLKQLPSIWTVDYRPRESVTVGTWLPGLAHKRTALYRPGLGCTIVPPDRNPQAVRAQRLQLRPDAWRDPLPWPQGEGAAEPAAASVSQRAIVTRHAQRMFAETTAELGRRQNTTALLVASHGHLLHEQYAEGFTREQTQLGWSMTKSLTSIIAGVFVRDHRLSLDAPVGLAQWKGTDKAKITWRQLLNMAPGLAWDEGYGGASDATEMLFSRSNQAGWAADRPLTSKPGSVFTYSTGTANIAMLGMRQLLGGSAQTIYDFYQEALFEPLGIHRGVIEPDASGTPVGGARGNLRPVDWLRLGQLVANHGAWNGELIIAQDYLQFMLAASPADAGYGGMIWRQPAQEIAPALRERLPADLVYFAGHLGQFLIIVPSARLVVLRMGVAFHYGPARDEALELAADLLHAD